MNQSMLEAGFVSCEWLPDRASFSENITIWPLEEIAGDQHKAVDLFDIPPSYFLKGFEWLATHQEIWVPLAFFALWGTVKLVKKRYKDNKTADKEERKDRWPIFTDSEHTSYEEFWSGYNRMVHLFRRKGLGNNRVTHTSVQDFTNNRIAREISEGKQVHIVRVLYRLQTPLVGILLKNDRPGNHIYFTDFENYNLRSFSYKEAKRNEESKAADRIAPETYVGNGHLYYFLQLADLLVALRRFSELRKSNLWRVKDLPTLRATIFGDLDKPYGLHFVTMKAYHSGGSGRLMSGHHWARLAAEELNAQNVPERVSIDKLKDLVGALHNDFLTNHWNRIKRRYEGIIMDKRLAFEYTDYFLKNAHTLSWSDLDAFMDRSKEADGKLRGKVVDEIRALFNALPHRENRKSVDEGDIDKV